VKHEIENGVHQLETLLEATIDKNFDKMEVFALRSIIAIPEELEEWMRLRHYEVCCQRALSLAIRPRSYGAVREKRRRGDEEDYN
jgi:hypothetical protein